jgi:hypothetical protein
MERILEEHSHEGEYMFIGIAVLMIVFIAVGVFLESRHVRSCKFHLINETWWLLNLQPKTLIFCRSK